MLPYQNSRVTIELREIVESGTKIFDFEYEGFYIGKDKENFEQKIIEHFFFRQIGQETVGRFLHEFRTKVREIMPYYKQMYESTLLMQKEDPFESYWLEEVYTSETTGNVDTSSSGTDNIGSSSTVKTDSDVEKTEDLQHIFSDTPQGKINNLSTHITNADKNNNTFTENLDTNQTSTNQSNTTTSNSSSAETSGSEKRTLTRRGNIGVQSLGTEVINLRNSFINIDMMIIEELDCVFLQIF